MITDLAEAKRLFEEDRAAAQAAYEAKIEEMRLQYEQVIHLKVYAQGLFGNPITDWVIQRQVFRNMVCPLG
jgi:hypothetical protein